MEIHIFFLNCLGSETHEKHTFRADSFQKYGLSFPYFSIFCKFVHISIFHPYFAIFKRFLSFLGRNTKNLDVLFIFSVPRKLKIYKMSKKSKKHYVNNI